MLPSLSAMGARAVKKKSERSTLPDRDFEVSNNNKKGRIEREKQKCLRASSSWFHQVVHESVMTTLPPISAKPAITREDIVRARATCVPSDEFAGKQANAEAKYLDRTFDGRLLRATLRALGISNLTAAEVDDVVRQITAAKSSSSRSSSGNHEDADGEAVVTVDDVLDWMDTITALNQFSASDGKVLSPASRSPPPVTITSSTTLSAAATTLSTTTQRSPRPGSGGDRAKPKSLPSLGPNAVAVPKPASPTATTSGASHPLSDSPPSAVETNLLTTFLIPDAFAPATPLAATVGPGAVDTSATATLSEEISHMISRDVVLAATRDPGHVAKDLDRQGIIPFLRSMLASAINNPSMTPEMYMDSWKRLHDDRNSDASGGKSGGAAQRHQHADRRTLAFASALAMQHVATSVEATMSVRAVLAFVDISGYSAVTSAIEHQGAHTVSGIVNGYLYKIVAVIRSHGGDIVKFAGDALLALWYTASDSENALAATRCALRLQQDCGVEPVPGTTLTLGLHAGLSCGSVSSRIFAPRKLRSNEMPSHFHFLSGTPLYEVSAACAAAKRGEIGLHHSMLPYFPAAEIQVETAGDPENSIVLLKSASNYLAWPKLVAPEKFLAHRTGAATLGVGGQNQLLFIPPRVARVLDTGMDQFFMAEMRDLVVLFVHFGGHTEVEVWFDEVFHILESYGCDVVQIIDDDKGIHIVAALNLYLMAEESVDAGIEICRSMEAKQCDAHVGIATGTVFCGVIGAPEACQWDISGAACVRAARLMQHATDQNWTACFDSSIFREANDRSSLRSMGTISVKGSADPVPVYTLRERTLTSHRTGMVSSEKVPSLHFHQSLCSHVHEKTIQEVRRVLHLLPPAIRELHLSVEVEESGVVEQKSFGKTPRTSPSPSVVGSSASGSTLISPTAAPLRTKVVVLTGASGTGKFCAAVNALKEAQSVPIVHRCYERQILNQLTLVHTLASWFGYSKVRAIKAAAQTVLRAFYDRRQNEAFAAGLQMMQEVCRDSTRSFGIIVRGGQFLDQSSVSFIGALAKRFEYCDNVVVIVTCSPLFGYPEPERRYLAMGHAQSFRLDTIEDSEVCQLVQHYANQRADLKLLNFVSRKTNKHVECIVELMKFLQQRAMLTLAADGSAHVRDKYVAEVDAQQWGELSPVIRLKAIHVLDHLTPELLTMCKIIAAITEQPLITAFFYSVSKVCESLNNAKLNVDDVRTLDSLWLLNMCEHKCTAHTGTGELDAAVFHVPAMRDITQSLLVPQQRVAINKICGDCYHETHPMDHPMQFLVRARHYLFAGMMTEYERDLCLGWDLLLKNSAKLKDLPVIKTRYFDWMREVDPAHVAYVLHDDEALQAEYEKYCRQKGIAMGASARGASRSSFGRSSVGGGSEFQILRSIQALSAVKIPLELAPARVSFGDLVKNLQLMVEMVDNGLVTTSMVAVHEEKDGATVDSLLDNVRDAVSTYATSVAICCEGASREIVTRVESAVEELKAYCLEALGDEATREKLREPASTSSQTDQQIQLARTLALSLLERVRLHVDTVLGPLCEELRKNWVTLLNYAHRATIVVRRRARYSAECALAETVQLLRDDAVSVEKGEIIVWLFENLSTILQLYAPGSERLRQNFCQGLEEFYRGTLQPPETYGLLRERTAVFLFSWLNCCNQQMIFQ